MESVKISEAEPVYKLVLDGKIASDRAQELEDALNKTIAQGAKYILLDMTGLTIIDSSGLSAIIPAIKAIKASQNGAIFAYGMSESIAKIFNLTRIDKFVKCFADESGALEHLKSLA